MYKSILFVLTIAMLSILAGCKIVEEPINLSSMPPSPQARQTAATPAAGTQAASVQESIDAALIWSEKYEKLLTEVEKLKKSNEDMLAENNKLKEQVATHKQEVAQTKKELKEANEVLVSMRLELSQWKKDILGFRDEMRQSQQALLAASAKILKELGAEIRQPVTEEQQFASN